MIAKWLLMALVLGLAYSLWRGKQRRAQPGRHAAAPPAPQALMLRCAHCGLHLPQGDAVLAQGQPYCCSAHAQLGPGPKGG